MFTLEAKVQPGRSYYFELTVETEPLRPAEVPREWTLSGERPGFAGGDRVLGGVGLTRAGLRRALAAGYANTGNEKYARAFSDMVYHLFQQCPSPLKAGVWKPDQKIPGTLPPGIAGGSMWSALAIGARLGHALTYYGRFVRSPNFPLEIRAAFIFNLAEMAEVLERMEAGGNWETQMADTLVELGIVYPEFEGAKRWLQQGVQRLIDNALSTVRPDGVLQEPTTGYHLLVMGRYRNLIAQSRQLQVQIPPEMVSLTEKMHEYVMYSTLPDGTLPIWGDGNPTMRPDMLPQAADLFAREDFRFVGTGGKQGQPPAKTSMGFPHGGFFYMRNSWQPDSHYMGIRCGPHGSHGHWDQLSIIVASYGNLLLIDPGVHIYGTPEAEELMHTRSHNTVTVDGRRTVAGGVPARWATGTRFDFFAGHNEGFQGLTDVRHHRRIWFVKPHGDCGGFWLIRDDVTGMGEHEAQLWFRFDKIEVKADASRKAVWTATDSGNLLIHSVGDDMRLTLSQGIAVPPRVNKLTEVPVACFSRKGSLPLAFTTLLLPYRGETPTVVKSAALSVTPGGTGAFAVWVEAGTRACLLYGNELNPAQPLPSRSVSLPDRSLVQLRAESAVVEFRRQGGRWVPVAIMGTWLQELRHQRRTLWRAETPQETVEVNLR